MIGQLLNRLTGTSRHVRSAADPRTTIEAAETRIVVLTAELGSASVDGDTARVAVIEREIARLQADADAARRALAEQEERQRNATGKETRRAEATARERQRRQLAFKRVGLARDVAAHLTHRAALAKAEREAARLRAAWPVDPMLLPARFIELESAGAPIDINPYAQVGMVGGDDAPGKLLAAAGFYERLAVQLRDRDLRGVDLESLAPKPPDPDTVAADERGRRAYQIRERIKWLVQVEESARKTLDLARASRAGDVQEWERQVQETVAEREALEREAAALAASTPQ